MRSGRELSHVGAHFSQNGSRRFLLDAGNGLKQSMCLREGFRAQARSNFLVEGLDLAFQKVQVMQGMPEQESMMICEAMPFERGGELRYLFSGAALGQLGHLFCREITRQQRVQNQPAGKVQYVTQNVAEFHIGIFQDFLNTIAFA